MKINNKRIPAAGFIVSTFLLMLVVSPQSPAQDTMRGHPDPAELVPSNAILYIHTAPLVKATDSLGYIMKNFLTGATSQKVDKWREDFKLKTGVDLLDAGSLGGAGVDVGRSAGMAYLAGSSNEEKIIIMIPVLDEKKFPRAFVEIMKKYNRDKPAADFGPAVTPYKNRPVYRMLKDVFFCTVDGYLLLAPSEKILHGIMDMRSGKGTDSLSSDRFFADFRGKMKKENDLSVFMKKSFISEIGKRKVKKDMEKDREKKEDAPDPRGEQDRKKSEGPPQGMREKGIAGLRAGEMELVEYIAVGLRKEDKGVTIELGTSLDRENVSTRVMERLFKTGIPEKLLVVENPLAYYYLSLDLRAVTELCASPDKSLQKSCLDFNKQLEKAGKSSGLDFKTEVLPYFDGFLNLVMRKSRYSRTMDNYVLLIPINNKSRSGELWKKFKKAARKNNETEGSFGEEKIDNVPSFWYKDKKGNKISVLAFDKGIYVGNNVEFLRSTMTGEKSLLKDVGVECIRKLDAGTFLVSYIRFEDESYLKTVLMLLTYKTSPELSRFFSRMGEMSVIGKRDGTFYSLCVTLKLAEDKREEQ